MQLQRGNFVLGDKFESVDGVELREQPDEGRRIAEFYFKQCSVIIQKMSQARIGQKLFKVLQLICLRAHAFFSGRWFVGKETFYLLLVTIIMGGIQLSMSLSNKFMTQFQRMVYTAITFS
eukprot:TRINITY_DN780_c0_g1_i2.p4 TRINITY_DN780_c0_g1~~TRINITY_DN780_c0_g1_i2.p4  ORF type:complete len:120 (-),score=4.46 TRINITY_DN780_c0_g1_i2:464-823(-)